MVATLAIAVAAGILIGLSLGALGGGGSILTVPALVYLLAVEPQSATSASLIIVGITSIIAAISHARARHVRWRAAAVFGILGSVTAFGGSILNRSVDPADLAARVRGTDDRRRRCDAAPHPARTRCRPTDTGPGRDRGNTPERRRGRHEAHESEDHRVAGSQAGRVRARRRLPHRISGE